MWDLREEEIVWVFVFLSNFVVLLDYCFIKTWFVFFFFRSASLWTVYVWCGHWQLLTLFSFSSPLPTEPYFVQSCSEHSKSYLLSWDPLKLELVLWQVLPINMDRSLLGGTSRKPIAFLKKKKKKERDLVNKNVALSLFFPKKWSWCFSALQPSCSLDSGRPMLKMVESVL